MSKSEPKYSVYGNEYVITTDGDCAEVEAVRSEDECILYSDNLDECHAAARKWVAEHGAAIVTHAKSGIDSITYSEADICSNRYEYGEMIDRYCICGTNNLTDELTDELIKLFNRVKRFHYK